EGDDGGGGALGRAEEFTLVEAEWPGDEHARERLPRVVVRVDGLVVVAPRGRELVLDVGELLLEREEVLGRAQLWVGLADRDQPGDRAAEMIVRLCGRAQAC